MATPSTNGSLTTGTPIPCPACRATMVVHQVIGEQLDLCGVCGGAWFSPTEFAKMSRGGSRAVEQVLREEPAHGQAVPTATVFHCPLCAAGMESYRFAGTSDVLLFHCPTCVGIFTTLDALLRLDQRDRELEGLAPMRNLAVAEETSRLEIMKEAAIAQADFFSATSQALMRARHGW